MKAKEGEVKGHEFNITFSPHHMLSLFLHAKIQLSFRHFQAHDDTQ